MTRKIASRVQKSSNARLTYVRLIDDLLDVSRLLAASCNSVSVPSILDRSSVTPWKRCDLDRRGWSSSESSESRNIWADEADPDRLTQVASNLLHNAIKFNSPGGQSKSQVAQHEHEVELVVTDNGCGIQPEDLHSIFEMFKSGGG